MPNARSTDGGPPWASSRTEPLRAPPILGQRSRRRLYPRMVLGVRPSEPAAPWWPKVVKGPPSLGRPSKRTRVVDRTGPGAAVGSRSQARQGREARRESQRATTSEQSKAVTGLSASSEDVRRLAKQTARAVSEQSDALAALAGAASKQGSGVATIARVAAEQASASERDQQGRGRHPGEYPRHRHLGGPSQTKAAVAASGEVGSVAAGIGKIRSANERQAEALETVTAALTSLRARGAEASPARSTDPA